MSEFTGKHVVVTGAAGTLGSAVASAFHGAGARVTGIDIVEADAPWSMTTADLIDPTTAAAAFAELGAIDVLANIAGGFTMGDAVADTSDATWDFMMNLNARTVLNAARAVVPGMKAAGRGKIINISARGGLRGSAAMGAYAASKAVVQRLTETLADELKADGINVNCILPSIIDTVRRTGKSVRSHSSRSVGQANAFAALADRANERSRAGQASAREPDRQTAPPSPLLLGQAKGRPGKSLWQNAPPGLSDRQNAFAVLADRQTPLPDKTRLPRPSFLDRQTPSGASFVDRQTPPGKPPPGSLRAPHDQPLALQSAPNH